MREKFLPYGQQHINEQDIEAVSETLRSPWITTGPKIKEFENVISKYVTSPYAIAVNSGTAALDIAVGSLNLPEGSEGITTPLTFAATANALIYNGIKPVFADVDRKTWNISPSEIRKKITNKTKVIICVDYSGQPCDLDEIRAIAKEHKVYLIEDAAHSLGAEYKGKIVGSQADITTFSFHPVKHITTGEGGMATTQNENLYKTMMMLRTHGIDKDAGSRYGPNAGWAYDMKMLGRNYRITDFQCALGISQFKRLESFIKKRRLLVDYYKKNLPPGVESIFEKPDRKSSWHLFPVLLPKGVNRDILFEYMRKQNIGVNLHYIPVYRHTYYQQHYPVDFKQYPVTEDIFSRCITLPLFPEMTKEDVDDVITSLISALDMCLDASFIHEKVNIIKIDRNNKKNFVMGKNDSAT